MYWIAISIGKSPSFSIYIGFGCNFSLFLFKYSTKDFKPPSKQKSAFLGVSSLKSSTIMWSPFVKNAISLNLVSNTSNWYSNVSKIVPSAKNLTVVPVLSESPILFKLSTTFPLWNFIWNIPPSLWIVTSVHSDNALTTDAPTPCRPPDTLYPLSPPNFPPACNFVYTVSAADIFVFGCISTGIPLPSSSTFIIFPGSIVTCIFLQYPAKASSTALSTISYTKWWSPLIDTLPIYIPGLFLTASSPSSTWICSALYSCSNFSMLFLLIFQSF